MNFFGDRSKRLKNVQTVNFGCSVCSNQKHGAIGVAMYFHLFRIPLLMYSKRVVLQCFHCRKVSEIHEIQHEDRLNLSMNIFRFSNSWHLSFGIIAIMFMVVVNYGFILLLNVSN